MWTRDALRTPARPPAGPPARPPAGAAAQAVLTEMARDATGACCAVLYMQQARDAADGRQPGGRSKAVQSASVRCALCKPLSRPRRACLAGAREMQHLPAALPGLLALLDLVGWLPHLWPDVPPTAQLRPAWVRPQGPKGLEPGLCFLLAPARVRAGHMRVRQPGGRVGAPDAADRAAPAGAGPLRAHG